MEAGGRMDVGGFQFHMCELRSTTGTLSSGLGGQIRRRPTSPRKSPVRVRLRNNKTTAAPARQRERQNSATLRLTIAGPLGP